MNREVNINRYIPPDRKEFRELNEIAKVENIKLKEFWNRIEDGFNDQFLQDMTVDGVKRWESMLNITPKGTETLEDRKFRISNRLFDDLPYTMRTLQSRLNALCGKNGYKIDLKNNEYKITIKVELTAKHQVEEIRKVLSKMIPANMMQYVELIYNTHEMLSKYTHEELSKFTHYQLREEVMK
ncbi:putative phage tail protein [Metaclostridioides mangenotii]|uniref:putative phage tail protein n=1 Tax=Metaclostridioides mangenotii TaxID=1540 RepID=UPI000463141C|nr:putative phage tail protein [Clostridioides mangenotii]